jgi:hypothetical protein
MRPARAVRQGPASRGPASVRGPLLAVVLALGPLASPASATWHAREEIPVESPVYRLIGELATSYPVASGLLLTRPWTRAELGRFLDQLVADVPAAAGDPVVQRLALELEPAGGIWGLEPAFAAEQEDASIEISPYLRASYSEDRAPARTLRDFRAGLQGSFACGEHVLFLADAYVGNVTPGPHGTPDRDGSFFADDNEVTVWFDRAYATWQSPGFSARAGHTWLTWGPGLAGTLALSDAAPALDLLEADVRLPGDARLRWFLAALDAEREAFLAGHRLAFRAGPSVEVGVSELARFDGSASAPLYLIPVVPYGLLDRRARGLSPVPGDTLGRRGRNNVMVALDFSWTWRPNVRLYGEFLLDDVSFKNERPLAAGWQAGVHLRRLLGGAAWSLRGDYTRVYRYVYSVSHGLDVVHAGFPTGFALGPDVDQVALRLEWRPDEAWAVGLEGVAVRKGADPLGLAWQPGDPVPSRLVLRAPLEEERRGSLTAAWSPSPSLTLAGAGGFTQLRGVGHVPGVEADGMFGRAAATLRW